LTKPIPSDNLCLNQKNLLGGQMATEEISVWTSRQERRENGGQAQTRTIDICHGRCRRRTKVAKPKTRRLRRQETPKTTKRTKKPTLRQEIITHIIEECSRRASRRPIV